MPNKIKPKRSYTTNAVPTAADLEVNELAINWADGIAYTKDSSGQIVSLTMGGGGGSSVDSRWNLFLPPAPTGLAGTAGDAEVSLSWTAPTGVLAQTPVTDYVVQYSSDGGSNWATFADGTSTDTTATVTGLTNDTEYTFRVAAVNGVGTGSFSDSVAKTPGAMPTDPYFSNVELLLHMDGSNNSTTFTDSSSKALAITASGNAKISTAQSKWGGTSGAFDGSGDYITPATSSGLAFGTGDFTVEAWIYPIDSTASANANEVIMSGDTGSFYLGFRSDGGVRGLTVFNENVAVLMLVANINSAEWSHVAVSRSGTSMKVFINGTQSGSTRTASDNFSAQITRIGGKAIGQTITYFNGYLDDVRITKGVARYTANFTPPTAAFPDA